MKKIKYLILGAIGLYVIACVFCFFYYSHLLNNLVPSENLIYSEPLSTHNKDNDIFTVNIIDDTVIFRRITHVYISPFGLVKIPTVQSEYTYLISNPDCSTHFEGKQEFNVSDFLESNSLIAKFYSNAKPVEGETIGYTPLFFGFCADGFTLSNVNDYKLKYSAKNGYIFAFYRQDNPDFDENDYKIAY